MDTAVEETPVAEQLYGLISSTITNISGTNITASSEMVDVLLDIANLVGRLEDVYSSVGSEINKAFANAVKVIAYYEELYGTQRPPDDWASKGRITEVIGSIFSMGLTDES